MRYRVTKRVVYEISLEVDCPTLGEVEKLLKAGELPMRPQEWDESEGVSKEISFVIVPCE